MASLLDTSIVQFHAESTALTRATIVLNFSQRRLRAAGLQTQRPSLAPRVTEEPSLADLHVRKSEARLGHQEIPMHRDERRLSFVDLPKDRRLMHDRTVMPRPQPSWQTLNVVSKC